MIVYYSSMMASGAVAAPNAYMENKLYNHWNIVDRFRVDRVRPKERPCIGRLGERCLLLGR